MPCASQRVSSAQVHRGDFSAFIDYKAGSAQNDILQSNFYHVQANSVYQFTWWYNIPLNTAGNFVSFAASFSGTPAGETTLFQTTSTTSGWVNGTGTFFTGSGTTALAFAVSFGALGGETQVYVDDVSMVGP